jgi:predicted alpha/beta-fold hydrolase
LSYSRPYILFNRHLETIYPALFRRVDPVVASPERIDTPDGDFLDLYWANQGAEKLVILCHGLEGNARRPYMQGMARAFFLHGFDVLTWDYRGCGEEMNRTLRFYHSGATDDLHLVIKHAAAKGYHQINLIGFSLGGNITLKYLGERHPDAVQIHRAVVFSVPMELASSCRQISRPENLIYSYRFLKSLKDKVLRKSRLMKGLDTKYLPAIRTLVQFDDRYTAPLHGFENASDYYHKCSSIHFLDAIETPTLIVNARNDPFLSAECFPRLDKHRFIAFEAPVQGGHAGFTQFSKNGLYWSEERAVRFIADLA